MLYTQYNNLTIPMNKWLFDDPPNVAVLTTHHILEGGEILFVSHDEDDGGWQFHASEAVSEHDVKVVALKEIVELDRSIMQLADLPLGWVATRKSLGQDWHRFDNHENLRSVARLNILRKTFYSMSSHD
jgi:hypothetical protein